MLDAPPEPLQTAPDEPKHRVDHRIVADPAPDAGVRTRRVGALVTLVSIALVALGGGLDIETLRSPGAAAFFLFGIGSAATSLLRRVSLPSYLLYSVTSSFTITLLTGFALAEAKWWHPAIAFGVLAVVAVGLHAWALARPTSEPSTESISFERLKAAAPALVPSVVGVVLVAITAIVNAGSYSGFGGAFARLGVPWFVGLVLVVAGIAASGLERARWAAGFTVVALSLTLALTPALLYEYPTVTSAARHVGVAQVIGQIGGVDLSQGIYHRWPGLFAGSEMIWTVGGVTNPLSWARWAAVLINPAATVGVFALVRRVLVARGRGDISDQRIWTVAALFTVVNILGNAYFSPQSVCFVLALVVLILAFPTEGSQSGRAQLLRLSALTITGIAITVTHQLTPYLLLPALFVLIVFRLVRPWQILLLVGVPALAWVAVNYSVLNQFINLDAIGKASNAAPPSHGGTLGYRGLTQWAIFTPMALFIVVGIAAAVVALRHRDRLRWALLLCAASPALLFGGNNYGNEALFRAALFSLPWLMVLIASARWRLRLSRVPVVGVALLAGVAVFALGTYGLDWYRVQRAGTVEAIEHVETSAPRGSVILTTGSGNAIPGRLTADSPDVQYVARDTIHALPNNKDYDAAYDVASLTKAFTRTGNPPARYALITTSTGAYDDLYGIQTYRDFEKMRAAFASSKYWTPEYRSPSATLYKLDVTSYRIATGGAK